VDEPDQLVRDLVEANRPLGLRALASAHTLRPETVPEVLGLTGDVEERSKVYAELPRLIPDGRELLALVERLRRETRNGNDLFWLEWLAQQVGVREDELQPEAEALLGRFFDHIPPPPIDAFVSVATPLDGQVSLWCEIPPGEVVIKEGLLGKHAWADGLPERKMKLEHHFRIAAVPVTRAQYACFDPDHKSSEFPDVPEEERQSHPVNEVTWYSAVAFCSWLARATPHTVGARLPREVEWEHACRAGTTTEYWSGDGEQALARVGWYRANSGRHTHRVGELPPNGWGLYDVHGNVLEWTLDRFFDGGDSSPTTESDLASARFGETVRVIRGGSFFDLASWARSSFRYSRAPWNAGSVSAQGFRVVLPRGSGDEARQ
jgi:formylglycine-generating enzyme required for sulfatase activity